MSIGEIPAVEESSFVDMPLDDGEPAELVATPLMELLAGQAPESVNVMEALTEEELTDLGAKVHRLTERDWKSGEKWRKRHANILKLYFGDLPPLPNGEELANAQVHYPIVATAVTRIAARIYDQQFPSNGEYFGCKPTDATDIERTLRVAKHMNWQVEHKITNYVANYDVVIIQFLLYGSAFTMLSYDHVNKCPKHMVIATMDIILPYKCSLATDPNMGDLPRITRVVRLYRWELEELEADGYYSDIDKLYEDEDERGAPQTLGNETTDPIQKAVDHEAGVDSNDENDPDAPRVLWEQHTRYRFNGEKKTRPVIVTIDKQTKRVVCLKIRQDEDPEDRARFNREKAANDAAYDSAMAQYEVDMAQYVFSGGAPGLNAPLLPGEPSLSMPPIPGATDATMPMVDPMMPVPPPRPEEPVQPRMVAINHFYHHKCLPNPEGVYGNGIGTWLEGPNMFADTVGAQIVNAGTLANTKGGFRSRNLRSVTGDVKFRPGEYQETDAVGKLADMILTMDFAPPDPTMGQLIKDQQETSAELSGANEILSGEVGGSNETATTTQIRISQALSNIAIINKRETRVRTAEGRGIARINSVHLTDAEFFAVVDPYKQIPGKMGPVVEEFTVSRADYLHDTDITITADPRMSSQPQRAAEAMGAMNMITQNPVLASNVPLVQAVAREYFLAIDRPQLIAAMMAMPPPMMGPVPGVAPGGAMPPQEGGGSPQPSPIPPPIPGSTQPPNTQAMEGEVT